MNIFPFLHFFTVMVYVYLAIYILLKSPKALENRLCASFLLSFAIWSFSMVFMHNPAVSKETARLWGNIAAFGWVSFGSLFLWFILCFTGKKEILKKKWLYAVLLVIPLVLIYKQWTNFIYVDYIKVYSGWKPVLGRSVWVYLFFFYYMSFMGLGLFIIRDFSRKTRSSVLKKQANIIYVCALLSLILGSMTNMILPLFNIHVIPDIADIIVLIWAFGVVYAMAKYKFLSITPATAAQNIISTMFDCLILLDMKGDIVAANKAAQEVSGYREEELKGMAVHFLLTEADENLDPPEETLSHGELKNEDFILKTKDNKEVPVILSSSLLRDETGAASGIVCIAKDMSARKRLEEEVLKSRKLESIGILAGGIAHDFNNLFTAMVGYFSMARDKMTPGKPAHKFIGKAEEISLKAAALARKFITLSPGGWVKREKVTVSHLWESINPSELPDGTKNISYNIHIPGDLLPISGDEDQLIQVMENLWLNAAEALPGENGKISLRAENVSIDAQNNFLLKEGDYIKISIADNGLGIPADIMDRIFDPYFSTKGKTYQKGLGLGLTVCSSIVKKHDGFIEVESSHGDGKLTGTTVTLYLPAFT